MPAIFLSYRRSDSQDVTGRIYDRLVARFTQKQVFKDVDNIPLGVSFPMHIKQVIGKTRVMLVIIGADWVNTTDEQGKRRLDDSNDFVRLEVETGLRSGMAVVPVLVSYTPMPEASQLPPSLRPLVTRNGMVVRPDPDFNTDMARLISAIEQLEKLFNAQAKLSVNTAPPPTPVKTDPPTPVKTVAPPKPDKVKTKKGPSAAPTKEEESQPAQQFGAGKSFGLCCGHGLWTGIVGGIASLGLTAVLFWLTIAGLLLFQKPVNNLPSEEGKAFMRWLERIHLTPPMPPVLLSAGVGPEGHGPGLPGCVSAAWECIAAKETGAVLIAWLIAIAFFGFVVGFSCRLMPSLIGKEWGKLLEALTIALTIGLVLLLWTHPNTEPIKRLGFYMVFVLTSVFWMSVQGYRHRSLLYILAVVMVGELKGSTIPVEFPATAIWNVYLLVCVPALVTYLGNSEDT
jgi:hypothetical protein